jgi:hypothetical protein
MLLFDPKILLHHRGDGIFLGHPRPLGFFLGHFFSGPDKIAFDERILGIIIPNDVPDFALPDGNNLHLEALEQIFEGQVAEPVVLGAMAGKAKGHGDIEEASGFKDTFDLFDGPMGIAEMLQHIESQDGVKTLLFEPGRALDIRDKVGPTIGIDIEPHGVPSVFSPSAAHIQDLPLKFHMFG